MHLADLLSLTSTFSVLLTTAAFAILLILLLPRRARGLDWQGLDSPMASEQANQEQRESLSAENRSSNRTTHARIARIVLLAVLLMVTFAGGFASGWGFGMDKGEREGTRAVTIRADLPWQNAGISVVAGQKISISAFGRWNNGPDGADYGPGGNGTMSSGVVGPASAEGALIGRIGDSPPFTIGDSTDVTAIASGQLRLAMNDWPDSYDDNHGTVTVLIAVQDR